MTMHVINSAESLQRVIGQLREAFNRHKFLRLNLRTGKDRTLDFNALSHVWYQQLELELPQDDALGWKAYCKLHFGVPLMRAEDAEFRRFYDTAILHLTYEQKLEAMKYVPVTSLMTNPQFKKYCDAMQADFASRGVLLEYPLEGK